MSNTIQIFFQEIVEANIDPHAKWELYKIKIMESTILYAKDKQRNQRNKQRETIAKLNDIENTIAKHKDDPALRTEMVKLKNRIRSARHGNSKRSTNQIQNKIYRGRQKQTRHTSLT